MSDDLGDVGDFETPAYNVEAFLKLAKRYAKKHRGGIAFMNLPFTQEEESEVDNMVAEGNFDEDTAEILKMAKRLDLFDFRGKSDDVEEAPADKPYYLALTYDNDVYLTFMSDPRLAAVVDWQM